jgi:ribosomal protein L37AE/L43A
MDKELRCPRCNSSQTRSRIRTGDRICYVCGNSFKLNEGEKSSEMEE